MTRTFRDVPWQRVRALLLLGTSAAGSIGAIGFWISGDFGAGLRVLGGCVLVLLALLLA